MSEIPQDQPQDEASETAVEYILRRAEIDPENITIKDIIKAYQLGWMDEQDLKEKK